MMTLVDLLAVLGMEGPNLKPVEVRDMTLDSRDVAPGAVFVALKGTASHGMAHAADAVARGAVAILYEDWEEDCPSVIPCIEIPQLRQKIGYMAYHWCGQPAQYMTLIGVTGTNGKTSVVHFISQMLASLGIRSGRIGTLGIVAGDQPLASGERTTPDAIGLAKALADMQALEVAVCTMEVSSHALDQHRVSGLPFQIAVWTNLTRDHLDYHGTMEAYAEAKMRLFRDFPIDAAVIDVDDNTGAALAGELVRPSVWTLGQSDRARVCIQKVQHRATGMTVLLQVDGTRLQLELPVFGAFNVKNVLLAMSALVAIGALQWSDAPSLCASLAAPPGRMECFGVPGSPRVVVDYAHTPDALENVLLTCRMHTQGRLTVVFGCGGDRDRGKRPIMGAVAERLADQVVLTSDNPRTENPEHIVQEIHLGMSGSCPVEVVLDRETAIARALADADPDDLILVAGKGHECTQHVGQRVLAHSDRETVNRLLEARAIGGTDVA